MNKHKILVCDADVGMGASFVKGLVAEGAYARACSSAPDKIRRRIALYEPEAALLFAGYSRDSLLRFIRELRGEFPGLRLFAAVSTHSLARARALFAAGAELCFFTPFSPEKAAAVMSAYLDGIDGGDREAAIACFLSSIGYRRTFAGFGYLVGALEKCLAEPEALASLYEEVYAYIAEKRGCRVEAVERVLRRDAKLYARLWAADPAPEAKFSAHDMIASLCDMYCASRTFL